MGVLDYFMDRPKRESPLSFLEQVGDISTSFHTIDCLAIEVIRFESGVKSTRHEVAKF